MLKVVHKIQIQYDSILSISDKNFPYFCMLKVVHKIQIQYDSILSISDKNGAGCGSGTRFFL